MVLQIIGIDLNIDIDEYFAIEDRAAWEEEIRKKHVYSNPLYNPTAEKWRVRDDDDRKRMIENAKKKANRPVVACPRCGSTQIQVVPRKWSLLTGFLTNKVDRVCVACKHKW